MRIKSTIRSAHKASYVITEQTSTDVMLVWFGLQGLGIRQGDIELAQDNSPALSTNRHH